MGAAGSILDDDTYGGAVTTPKTSPTKPKKVVDPTATYPTFIVSLSHWPGKLISLPDQFKLRISYESMDFVRSEDGAPLVQFPFQNIICWGSSPQNFQFKVFDLQSSEIEKRDKGILISLKTSQGKMIEEATMSTVQKLMADMTQAMSKPEFQVLLTNLFDDKGQLVEDWMPVINQFTSSGRKFLAKQGMELLLRIGPQVPFEKFDLACLIFERLINKNSVQLLINTFEDPQDRENLIHRLKLDKEKIVAVTDCTILPEYASPTRPIS
jgi:hypothetical protein